MALECVNEEFNHFFVVDTPPSTPVKKKKSKPLASYIKKINYFLKSILYSK